MVEVFKTSVQNHFEKEAVLQVLGERYPQHKISLDIEDIDNVLRLEGLEFQIEEVLALLLSLGVNGEVMPY